MNSARQNQIAHASRRRRWRASSLLVTVMAATLMFAGSLVAMALAAGSAATVSSASNSTLGEQIVIDAQGRTLYALSPETAHHLLCKSSECLKFWPPLTVHSSKTKLLAGPGVHGHLAILRRSNGMLQVMLGGLPLYRYSGDQAKGEANGQSIHSFGGTWHVLSATGSTSPATPAKPTTPSPTPEYSY
jgi:predicted lipoprotein with Yx(FWY)xxD motif